MSHRDDLRMMGELIGRSSFELSASDDVIELRRGRSALHFAVRLLISLFLLPFLVVPLLLLLEPDIPSNIPAAVFHVVWYGLLGGFVALLGEILFRWRCVSVDRDRGLFEAEGGGRLLWLPRRVIVPLGAIRKLELRLGPEGLRPTPFTWRLTHAAPGGRPRKLAIGAMVEGIDRREEAAHLTARIARLMGWSALEVTRRADVAASVRFAPSETDLDDPRPIPPLEEVPDYGVLEL